MTGFRFLPAAESELFREIAYYSAIRPELGVEFEAAVSTAVRKAAADPAHGAPRSKNTRRWLVKGFPFGVIYSVETSGVLVVAVANLRRRPDYWAKRIE